MFVGKFAASAPMKIPGQTRLPKISKEAIAMPLQPAAAFLDGRGYTLPEDVRAMAPDVLRHRVLPTYEAEADGITADELVKRLLDKVPMP